MRLRPFSLPLILSLAIHAIVAIYAIVSATPLARAGDTGTIKGKVTFVGSPPQAAKLDTSAEASCERSLTDESLVVDRRTKGVRSTVVWVEGTKGAVSAGEPPVIDNERCRFEPHVVIAHVGKPIVIRNKDRFLHTTQASEDGKKTLFNVALPVPNAKIEKKIDRRGMLSLRCDVHRWMSGWAAVLEGEISAVTDASGSFTLEDVPAGKHRLRLWHETLGEKTAEVNVLPGKTAKIAVSWAAPR